MILQPLLVIRVIALLMGPAVFWILSSQKEKKKPMDHYASILTTWLLFFIGAKGLTQWELLLDYPLSVLAYPSGTAEFYIASIATVLWEWRKRHVHKPYVQAYFLMLASSMVSFSLLERLVLDDGHLVDVIFAFSFFVMVVLHKQRLWSVFFAFSGALLAGGLYRAPDLMGYRMDPVFYLVVALMSLTLILLKKGGKNHGG
ncbi:hypothetical protein LC065_01865 [Halobacillus litoralis]|uniref:hypothetical protein n=1 Tax=Halobacillus litoralis TaxID=45668 RepID=UPI001CFD202D|nr:hypothetical protein [Halobacillus litoralis]WLR48052.1 hypothetical protein LC065_01865 [Halobacillus litoralis]